MIKRKSRRQLPGYVDFVVLEEFIKMFVSQWEAICLESFRAAEKSFDRVLRKLSDQYFGRFESSGLLQDTR